MDDWTTAKLGDVVNLILGMTLFFSPWLLVLPPGVEWRTASVMGLLIAVASIAALAAFAVWEEWLNLIAGLGLMLSPWLFGFQEAITFDLIVGGSVAALAAFEVWLARQTVPQVSGSRLG